MKDHTLKIKADFEIKRLQTKCEFASQLLETVDKAIRDSSVEDKQWKVNLRDYIDGIRTLLNEK